MSGTPALINGKTKTQIVRDTVQRLGFVTEKVPEGWFQRVEKALLEHKPPITVHETVIYQTRKELLVKRLAEIKRLAEVKATAPETEKKPESNVKPKVVSTSPVPTSPNPVLDVITLSELMEIVSIAKKFGGIRRLSEVVRAVQSFMETLKTSP